MRLLLISAVLLISGCSGSTDQIATKNGFKHQPVQTSKFNLTSYQKITQAKVTPVATKVATLEIPAQSRNAKPQAQDVKSQVQDIKPKTQSAKPQTQDVKSQNIENKKQGREAIAYNYEEKIVNESHNIEFKRNNLKDNLALAGIETTLNIYIEGDGRITRNRYQISNDPSPRKPTVMQLAALDPNPNVVYLARPCQYSPHDLQTVCQKKHWTDARYSKEIVQALDQAIDQIKQQAGATQINLIGFSGGGALAVLIAASRDDIASIRTVAGNLDLQAMQAYHNSNPLTESLDPIAVAEQVQHIPQVHFVGNKDNIVPVAVSENFCKCAKLKPNQVQVLKGVSHHDGWAEQWPQLLALEPIIN